MSYSQKFGFEANLDQVHHPHSWEGPHEAILGEFPFS